MPEAYLKGGPLVGGSRPGPRNVRVASPGGVRSPCMAGAWTRTLARIGLGRGVSPVRWARWGPLSRVLGAVVPLARPAVLILSLPRSGSSWVGSVLGRSGASLYLREPMTQTTLAVEGADRRERLVDTPVWRDAARDAFRGLPRYRRRIVVDPAQWRLRVRRGRRVVVKEVTPSALPWLQERFAPRVVFLVRHPAAVASSVRALGWNAVEDATEMAWWAGEADRQARVLGACLDRLTGRDDATLVRYEDLCTTPVEGFRELHAFARLPWTEAAAAGVLAETTSEESYEVGGFDLQRDSRRMVDRWKQLLTAEQRRVMAQAWLAHDLPLYPVADW